MAKDKTIQLKEERPEDLARSPRNLRQHPDGRERPDPTPEEPPLGYKKQPSIFDQVRAMVRSDKLKEEALAAGKETFEEADDFDLDEDEDPHSPYENEFDPIPDADRRALRGELPPLDDPELQRQYEATQPRQTRSNPTAPVEGAGEGSPDDPPSPDPAGRQPVRSYFRRPPAKPSS